MRSAPHSGAAAGPPRRRPVRLRALLAAALSVALLGVALERLARPSLERIEPASSGVPAAASAARNPSQPLADAGARDSARAPAPPTPPGAMPESAGDAPVARDDVTPREHAVAQHFQRGVALLHARRPEYAAVAFHEVLRLAPRLPEAHVNMGYALLAQRQPGAARDFFVTAIDLRPSQANAYYGLAVTSEALGDRPGALGAMRAFVHLAETDDPFVRKARAALWEWQSLPAEAGARGTEPASTRDAGGGAPVADDGLR